MRYVSARIEERNRDEMYRIFVTKSLQLNPQNKYITIDYIDMFKPQKIDNRSAEQVVVDLMKEAGLNFGE